jgi:hypothetical protein
MIFLKKRVILKLKISKYKYTKLYTKPTRSPAGLNRPLLPERAGVREVSGVAGQTPGAIHSHVPWAWRTMHEQDEHHANANAQRVVVR